jgi:hypothetical protein
MYRVAMAALAVLLIALPVQAEPDFPAAIQTAGSTPCNPPCTLCHTSSPGTRLTATKPFAITLIKNGLIPTHPESIATAVTSLRSKQVDTDGDGVLDVDELAAGTDPSNPTVGVEFCGPLYGCAGGHIAKVPPRRSDRAPWVLASALALLLLSRMRRARGAR